MPSALTSGSFLTLCAVISRSASASEIGPVWTTSRSRGVMRSATGVVARHEAHVALGQQPLQPPRVVDHGQRADAGALHHARASPTRWSLVDGVRIGDDAVLGALDRRDLGHLRRDVAGAEAAVDDADAAFLGQHDGHRRPRDGVHVGRDDRTVQREVLGEARRQVDGGGIAARQHAELRREQEVVESTASDKGQEIHGRYNSRFTIHNLQGDKF